MWVYINIYIYIHILQGLRPFPPRSGRINICSLGYILVDSNVFWWIPRYSGGFLYFINNRTYLQIINKSKQKPSKNLPQTMQKCFPEPLGLQVGSQERQKADPKSITNATPLQTSTWSQFGGRFRFGLNLPAGDFNSN